MNLLFILPFFLILSSCVNTNQKISSHMPDSHTDSLKQFIYTYVDEIWNKGNFEHAETYWGPDFRNVFSPGSDHGPEGMQQQVAYFLGAFNPYHFEIKDLMIDGEKVSMWIEITGTHTGELFGIKPTHKQVMFREAVWYKLKNGKLDEVYPFVDWNSLFLQLGTYPEIK